MEIHIQKDEYERKLEIGAGEQCVVFLYGNPKLDLEARLTGEGASLKIFGRFYGKENTGENITLHIVQSAPRTNCFVHMRSVLADAATSTFDGLIRMEGDVRESTAVLSYRALLLSDQAKAKPIPKLEILNKNIAIAKHEASVGKIEEGQLFYLQSRGISRPEAEKMITDGFLAPQFS